MVLKHGVIHKAYSQLTNQRRTATTVMIMAAARIGTTMTHHGSGAGGWGLFRITRAAGITEIRAYNDH